MPIRHLSYFVALAQEKHYARAARAFHGAQPTITTAIEKREEDLQVHLVARGHRFMGLTPDGEKALEWRGAFSPFMPASRSGSALPAAA